MALRWRDALVPYVRAHPTAALGLLLGAAATLWLLAANLSGLIHGGRGELALYAFCGGLAGFAGTALGALPGLVLTRIPQKLEDTLLGGAAGMMLAASAFSLLLPGLDAGRTVTGSSVGGAGLTVLGMALGVALMLGLDEFTPHEHDKSGPCGPAPERCAKVWLFVFAIALHNLPEGAAIGVGYAGGDLHTGIPLTAAIALQDVPEGLAVALSLRSVGLSASRAVLIAAATGLLEIVGAMLGVGMAGGLAVAYPIGLGIAAGAMIFVVSHEVIPETHRNGHQTAASLGLMAGFALMMVLDTTLG